MTVTVTVANSVPAGSLGAAFSSFSASGLFTLTGVEDGLTAHAGGTQAAALALSSTKNFHRVSVCATEGDSVLLPPATVGQQHFVRNDGAASCQVFGTSPDTIDGVATATGVALPAGVGRWFVCLTAAKWVTDAAATTTGSGANVLATSPTLVTPELGAAHASNLTLGVSGAIQNIYDSVAPDANLSVPNAANGCIAVVRNESNGTGALILMDGGGTGVSIISDPSNNFRVIDPGPGSSLIFVHFVGGKPTVTNRYGVAKTLMITVLCSG